jgi:hypothetical protein
LANTISEGYVRHHLEGADDQNVALSIEIMAVVLVFAALLLNELRSQITWFKSFSAPAAQSPEHNFGFRQVLMIFSSVMFSLLVLNYFKHPEEFKELPRILHMGKGISSPEPPVDLKGTR